MNWKFNFVTVLLLLISACACPSHKPEQYTGQNQAHDLAFLYNVRQQPDAVTLKGQVKNTFHHRIYQLQLFGVLTDENGKPVGKEAIYLGPVDLTLDQSTPFSLTIPVSSSITPRNIRLEYRYHLPSHGEAHWSWTYGRIDVPAAGA